MATFGDLMRASFTCIGQLRPGFGYAPEEMTNALFHLNAMLDSWSADELDAAWTLIQSFPLTSGVQTYTVGPGGTWNGVRPVRVDVATLVVLTNPVQPLRLTMRLLNAEEWQSIDLQATQSTLTRRLWYNPTNPLGTVNVWPVPTENDNVELSSWGSLAGNISSDATSFVAPPGYLEALIYNLAVRLSLHWDKPLKLGTQDLADKSLAVIQRINAPTPQMQVNPGVMPIRSGRGSWNWLTGDEE
jgi:hypothetical protein